MNGEPLPYDHGFPARLLVPGWVGIASIKWLGEIEVADRPLFSHWNTTQYRMVGPDYPPDAPPLATQPVKSAFELPFDAPVQAGPPRQAARPLLVGQAAIRRVSVRVDGPQGTGRWRRRACAERTGRARGCAGRRLAAARPGRYELLACATDSPARRSPRPSRPTPPATSSGRSSATQLPPSPPAEGRRRGSGEDIEVSPLGRPQSGHFPMCEARGTGPAVGILATIR